jgi:hypothetical protein
MKIKVKNNATHNKARARGRIAQALLLISHRLRFVFLEALGWNTLKVTRSAARINIGDGISDCGLRKSEGRKQKAGGSKNNRVCAACCFLSFQIRNQ